MSAAHNAAVHLRGGRQSFAKTLLPTYDVFDEDRYFEPGVAVPSPLAYRRAAVSICEDVWNDPGRVDRNGGDPVSRSA